MPRPSNLIPFEIHLDNAYGHRGSKERDAFEVEVELDLKSQRQYLSQKGTNLSKIEKLKPSKP